MTTPGDTSMARLKEVERSLAAVGAPVWTGSFGCHPVNAARPKKKK